jgi:hypothetical protein
MLGFNGQSSRRVNVRRGGAGKVVSRLRDLQSQRLLHHARASSGACGGGNVSRQNAANIVAMACRIAAAVRKTSEITVTLIEYLATR